MIWKPIQRFEPDFVAVMKLPEGLRKRRSLWRLSRVNPALFDSCMKRWESMHKRKKGRNHDS